MTHSIALVLTAVKSTFTKTAHRQLSPNTTSLVAVRRFWQTCQIQPFGWLSYSHVSSLAMQGIDLVGNPSTWLSCFSILFSQLQVFFRSASGFTSRCGFYAGFVTEASQGSFLISNLKQLWTYLPKFLSLLFNELKTVKLNLNRLITEFS